MKSSIDLKIAKALRDEEGYAVAIVKDENILYKSKDKGILPLYLAFDSKEDMKDASAADKIVGKGAAMFMAELGITHLDTLIISKSALKYLQECDIVVSYSKLVEYIKNRTGDGKCPVETMADASKDFDELLDGVKQFLKRLELI
ncbi:MAG: DUF1893 domain-containing protein [Eubacteriales bacterium]